MINIMRRKNWKQGLDKFYAEQFKKEQMDSPETPPSHYSNPVTPSTEINTENENKDSNEDIIDNTDNVDNTDNIDNTDNVNGDELKINKRPKDDLSDLSDNDNIENKQQDENANDTKEITDFQVIDVDERWNKETALGIYDAFKEESYFNLGGEKQFVLDLKDEEVKIKKVQVEFNGVSFATEINVFASSTEDEYYDWIEIGVLQLYEKTEDDMKVSVDINEYSNNRYLKIIFNSQNDVQIKRIKFFA